MTESIEAVKRGRPVGWRKPPLQDRPHTETSVFDIDRWCRDGDFSRTWIYAEWTAGRGPHRVRIGGKVKITESPREYCERVAREFDYAIYVQRADSSRLP